MLEFNIRIRYDEESDDLSAELESDVTLKAATVEELFEKIEKRILVDCVRRCTDLDALSNGD